MTITKDTLVSEVLEQYPNAMPVFQSIGMHCMGCALAGEESLEEACSAHGESVEELLQTLHDYLFQD